MKLSLTVVFLQLLYVSFLFSQPVIIEQSCSANYHLGSKVEIYVLASGIDLKYQWQRDGLPLHNETSFNIVIDKLGYEHSGSYTCSISSSDNNTYIISKPIVIYVIGNSEIFVKTPFLDIPAGENAALEVEVHNPDTNSYHTKISWFRGELPLTENEKLHDNDRFAGTESNRLSIFDIQKSDFNDTSKNIYYYAVVQTPFGTDTSAPMSLFQFDFQTDVHQYVGDMVCPGINYTIKPSLKTKYPMSDFEFIWYEGAKPITDSRNGKFEGWNTTILKINNLDIVKPIFYQLVAIYKPSNYFIRTAKFYLFSTAEFTILGPHYNGYYYPEINLKVDDPLKLSVTALTGGAKIFKWFRDNQRVGGYDTNLFIAKVKKSDAGIYYFNLSSINCSKGLNSKPVKVNIADKLILGVNDDADNKPLVYPNPTQGIINIFLRNSEIPNSHAQIHDVTGNKILNVTLNNEGDGEFRIDLTESGLIAGSYFINIRTNSENYFIPFHFVK